LAYYIAAKAETFGFFNLTETNMTNTTKTLTKDEYDDFKKNNLADYLNDWEKIYNKGKMYIHFF